MRIQYLFVLFCLLYVLFSCITAVVVVGESCSEGFMDYTLLTAKDAQIPNSPGSLSDGTIAENVETRRIIRGDSFNPPSGDGGSCSLTEVILGVDIRPVTDNRNRYPSIEIWEPSGANFGFVSFVPVTLSPVNFTTSGVYRYTFPAPVTVENDYRLGVRQPPNDRSVVRLFRRSGTTEVWRIQNDDIDDNSITNGKATDENFDILIHPITDPLNCLDGFLSMSTVISSSSSITNISAVTDQTRVFPDIHITCDGIITSWTVGTAAIQSSNSPLVQLRRSTMLYTALTLNTANGTLVNGSTNLYNFSVSVPVKAGDILVITSTADPVYYQQFNGPLNYQIVDSDNSLTPLDSNDYPLITAVIHSTSPSMEMSSSTVDIAVISSALTSLLPTATDIISSTISASTSSVIITTSVSSVLPTVDVISSSVNTMSLMSTTDLSSVSPHIDISNSITVTTNSISLTEATSTSVQLMPTSSNPVIPSSHIITTLPVSSPMITAGGNVISNGTSAIVGAVIASLLIVLLIVIGSVLALILVVHRRHRKIEQSVITVPANSEDDALTNPVYSETELTDHKVALGPLNNPVYGAKTRKPQKTSMDPLNNPVYGANETSAPPLSTNYHMYEEGTGILYEEPVSSAVAPVAADSNTTLPHDTSGFYCYTKFDVPPSVSTAAAADSNTKHGHVYSVLQRELCVPTATERARTSSEQYEIDESIYSSLLNTQNDSKQTEFFLEDPIYWEPGSDTDDIYQQLSDRKYREIVRQQIQVTGSLGSGQFGTVHQGIWYSPSGPVDAAIKTLNDNTSEEERVKFLQEAAIMGQFHHSNVVKLLGVVTLGEPTMIVLELISGGDLREYLQKHQPSPGELVQSTLPTLLLNFCHQIASGMKYLSNKCFVHRDLAARNILVAEHSICKIADFGMSRDLQDENYYISHAKKIPIKWTAPEALHYKRYSTASDVWSYGAVLYEIWSLGHKPFESYTNQQCIRLVETGYRLPPPPGCPRAVYELMIQCWHPETSRRPTFVDLVNRLSPTDTLLTAVNTSGSQLGGKLETGHRLYTDLQNMYRQ